MLFAFIDTTYLEVAEGIMKIKVCHVVGARPNFMKAAPLIRAFSPYSEVEQVLVHTGQHYDVNMSDVFFQQLGIGAPDYNLKVGSGSHAQQTAAIMSAFEIAVQEIKPSIVVVFGDVNSTIAAALVCAKLGIKVAHVEAGLRAFDRTMPEEINRILTDQLADYLFTVSDDGNQNLLREGVAYQKLHLVGNIMIDSLIQMLPSCSSKDGLPARYVLVTMHRPSNVDDLPWLESMLQTLGELSGEIPILFPVHPRTRKCLDEFMNGKTLPGDIRFLQPQPYLQFLNLQKNSTLVITDSGGIQEETTYLGIPCLTVRENTERPITVTVGTNTLVGRDLNYLREKAAQIIHGNKVAGTIPPLWDGHTAERIASVLVDKLSLTNSD